jgi:hypothetical protein
MPRPNLKNIKRFEEYRAAKTLPPPPRETMAGDWRAKANEIRRIAAGLLASANDLDAAANALENP